THAKLIFVSEVNGRSYPTPFLRRRSELTHFLGPTCLYIADHFLQAVRRRNALGGMHAATVANDEKTNDCEQGLHLCRTLKVSRARGRASRFLRMPRPGRAQMARAKSRPPSARLCKHLRELTPE